MIELIRIRWKKGELTAQLYDTPTARKLIEALPVEAKANTWGEEVYFTVPVKATLEPDARQVVEPGTVCFWVQGQSLALPFGPTPISQENECRLVTKVNVLGKIQGDSQMLKSIRDGDSIGVEKVE
jgi:hypothetical protein